MRGSTPRFLLRDFIDSDSFAFLGYQADPRYRRLYDIPEGRECHASSLFESFLAWQADQPRQNYQVGIFDRKTGRLCGCGGVRISATDPTIAVLGIELTPDDWGRYRLAVETVTALIDYGFDTLQLERIVGATASGNTRTEKLARWFGAEITDSRPGPDWMLAKGWNEVTWSLDRTTWTHSAYRRRRPRQ